MSLARTTAARSKAAFTADDPWVGTTIMNGPPYTIWEGIIVCKCWRVLLASRREVIATC
jgi:hypothetical protein